MTAEDAGCRCRGRLAEQHRLAPVGSHFIRLAITVSALQSGAASRFSSKRCHAFFGTVDRDNFPAIASELHGFPARCCAQRSSTVFPSPSPSNLAGMEAARFCTQNAPVSKPSSSVTGTDGGLLRCLEARLLASNLSNKSAPYVSALKAQVERSLLRPCLVGSSGYILPPIPAPAGTRFTRNGGIFGQRYVAFLNAAHQG